MIPPCSWWRRRQERRGRRHLLRLSIIIFIASCCRSSSALLLLLNTAPSKFLQNSWGPSVSSQRPNFLGRRLLGSNNNNNNDHDTRHSTASLLFTTGSITPPPTTTAANTTTPTKRFLNFDGGGDDGDKKKKKNNNPAKQWNVMFEKLKAYKEMHGNCLVPQRFVCDDGTKLGRWVITQRQMVRYDRPRKVNDAVLLERRRRELDAIGFVWVVNERKRQVTPDAGVHDSKKDRFNARWNVMFDKLKEYKAEHGNCQVPYSYNCTDGTLLGEWVRSQRKYAATDSDMNPLRRRALDSIGFVWQVRVHGRSQKLDEQWNEKFRLLQEYHAEHGDCLVPFDYMTGGSKIMLGSWVRIQRVSHAAGKLRKDRLIRLESLGFSFRALPDNSVQANWDRFFERLVQYKRQYGDCRVPTRYKIDPQLGRWVETLRTQRNTLSAHERAQLDGIDFCWDAGETRWQDMFEELHRFQKQHGHCLVTKMHEAQYPKLQRWVLFQRKRRGKGQMDGEQIKQLDSIGFIWDVFDTQWQAQFEALERFQKEYGHCLVTKEHEAEYPGLPLWVKTQRQRRGCGPMDGGRIQQLDDIGFIWKVLDTQWQAQLEALQRFQEQYGHCLVTRRHEAEYPGLRRWVQTQRDRRGRGEMEGERIQQLDDIGFV